MKKFGLGLDGCENGIEALLKQHVEFIKSDVYNLIEIGSAGCVTLRAMKDIVSEKQEKWKIAGFDLPNGWSLDWVEINKVFDNKPKILKQDDLDNGKTLNENEMTLFLLEDPRKFLKEEWKTQLDFVFIDGCHGKCAADDFLAIEDKVKVGGIVMFHDFAFIDQGRDFQPHCQEMINVRKHLKDIGLYDTREVNKTPFRDGWRFIAEIQGSRYWGGGGNSCGVFQKTK